MKQEIDRTWHFNQPSEEVWKYLTEPELMEQWFARSDIRPVIGHTFRMLGPGGSVVECEVLAVKPFELLSYSWRRPSAKDGRSYTSKVTWTLTPKANGTELRLVHGGFIATEDLTAHDAGWAHIGDQLVALLNARHHAGA